MTGQAGSFTGDAFHQIAIADNGVGVMIDHVESVTIKACCQPLLGNRGADFVDLAKLFFARMFGRVASVPATPPIA